MAASAIGALRVTLGIDTAAFQNGLNQAQKQLVASGKRLEKVGASVGAIGKSMAANLSLPIAGAGVAIIKYAGDFEASMNKIGISTKASGAQMKAMNDLALQLGKSTVFSASEAANAMDMLAKNGLTATQILGGAAKAAIDLAAAAGSELDPAAAAITDTMANFGKTTKQLPSIVNQITGAVNQSKFDFDDFRLAMGSAGGVAGKVGVNFEDFAAVLAGTSSSFSSGEDAGTSFKSMLLSIGSPSKKAQAAIDELGLQFFDATGKMKPMSAIADMLKASLAGLSDQKKLSYIGDIFGSDGGRTVLAMMQLGAKGLDDIKTKIAATDAAAQSAQRLKGFNGQLEQLKGSIETLAIKFGQSGILEAITGLVTNLGNLLDTFSEASPATLRYATVIGLTVAAIAPLLIGVGAMVNAVGAIIPVMIKVAPLFTSLVSIISTTVIPILATLARSLIGLAVAGGPLTLIVLALGAVYLAWQNWDKIVPIVRNLYVGVKTWLSDKLGAIFDAVKGKIAAVGDAFYTLWDRVVGHSYVPDMVDEIGNQMARLDGNMVTVAGSAAAKTAETFQALAARVGPLLDKLFPDQAKFNAYQKNLADLKALANAGGLTPSQLGEAQTRLGREYNGVDVNGPTGGITEPDFKPITDGADELISAMDPRLAALQSANDKTAESYANMARDVAGSFQSLVNNIKSGDWLSALTSVLDIVGQVSGILKGTSVPATRTYSVGATPGFATGGSFQVQGMRGVDANMLALNGQPIARVSHGETVGIGRGGSGSSGGVMEVRLRDEMLDARIISGSSRVTQAGIQQNNSQQSKYAGRKLGR